MNNTLYSRERKIQFDGIVFEKKNIKTKSKRVLNICQKYITLLLEQGICAGSKKELVEKISKMLNIKNVFVDEYLAVLSNMKLLEKNDDVYYISKENCHEIDHNDDRIIMNNIKMGMDNLKFIYLYEIDTILSKTLLSNSSITSTKETEVYLDDTVKENYLKTIINQKEVLNYVANKSLSNIILDDIELNVSDMDMCEKIKVNIPLELIYDYDEESKKGILKDFNYVDERDFYSVIFNKKYIFNKLKFNYIEDTKTPGFILFREVLKKQEAIIQKIQAADDKINVINLENENLDKDISIKKDEVEQAKVRQEFFQEQLKSSLQNPMVSNDERVKLNENAIRTTGEYLEKEQQLNEVRDRVKTNDDIKKKIEKEKNGKIEELNSLYKSQFDMDDSFEKKLYDFYLVIEKDSKKYKYVYDRYKLLVDILLESSKCINDGNPFSDHQFDSFHSKLTDAYSVFCTVIKNPNAKFESLKKILDTNSHFRITLLSKNIKASVLDNLIKIEYILDGSRHFDRINSSFQLQRDKDNIERAKFEYANFNKMEKKDKKDLLYTFVELFYQGIKNEDDWKLLDHAIKSKLEIRENLEC